MRVRSIPTRSRKIGDCRFFSGDKRDDNNLTEDKVAMYNEFGTQDIPSRPFMRKEHNVLQKRITKGGAKSSAIFENMC
ncbi:MAG: hypothetical protein IJ689_02685 [Alphaproteobacteria bacterium]|nr:hypothetical protein [Alphaproteobacteria bacterium]